MSIASAEINLCKDGSGEFNMQKINDFPFEFIAKVNNFFKRDESTGKNEDIRGKISLNNSDKVYFDSKASFFKF